MVYRLGRRNNNLAIQKFIIFCAKCLLYLSLAKVSRKPISSYINIELFPIGHPMPYVFFVRVLTVPHFIIQFFIESIRKEQKVLTNPKFKHFQKFILV